ncbi:MAG TPA: hypothetical protein PKH79_13910 [Prolixibacteraceae bacterium]|nr:hypothetical protein [Prolixibacteraceae bacterium]HPS14006.1 hypothetical protein [Prolixibacteraceae bacterium]
MSDGKPRVIKDYDKLPLEIQEQIKLEYPYGFSDNLIRFTNKDGLIVSALPFETEDKYYMVRMTVGEAIKIVEDDDDFDDDGILKEGIKEEYENKYGEEMEGMEEVADDSDFDDDDYGDDDLGEEDDDDEEDDGSIEE